MENTFFSSFQLLSSFTALLTKPDVTRTGTEQSVAEYSEARLKSKGHPSGRTNIDIL